LRRRRLLGLGLPLLVALEPPDRVALIAHELAHQRNGDPARFFVIHSSVVGLATLYWALRPSYFENRGDLVVVQDIATGMVRALSWPVGLVLRAQIVLMLRHSQRAEYLADHLAAEVAGSDAVVSLHEKLLLGGVLDGVLQRQALDHRSDGAAVIGVLRDAVRAVPDRERERRRRAARLEDAHLLTTHPPTGRRIEFLRRRPALAPRLVLDAQRAAQIEAELARRESALGRRLVDKWRSGRRLAS
jgi:Zn-dependent protease with chaperone function